jgi:LPXTG-motif cell wall-anchored protein
MAEKPASSSPVLPMVAIGVGALFLGGGGGLWLMRRKQSSA